MSKYYWAGFDDSGNIVMNFEFSSYAQPRIFKTKKQAKMYYTDVRKVEIREVRNEN